MYKKILILFFLIISIPTVVIASSLDEAHLIEILEQARESADKSVALFKSKNYNEAVKYKEAEIELWKTLESTVSYNTRVWVDFKRNEAKSYGDLARIYTVTEDFDKALIAQDEDINISKDLWDRSNISSNGFTKSIDSFIFKLDLAVGYESLSIIYSHQKKFSEAKKVLDLAIGIWERVSPSLEKSFLAEEMGGNQTINEKIGVMYNAYGLIFKSEKKYKESIIWYKKALSKLEKDNKLEGDNATIIYGNIARAYIYTKKYTKAKELLEEKIGKIDMNDNLQLSIFYFTLSLAYKGEQNYCKSLDYLSKSLNIRKKLFAKGSSRILKVESEITDVKSIMSKKAVKSCP